MTRLDQIIELIKQEAQEQNMSLYEIYRYRLGMRVIDEIKKERDKD